MCVLGFWGVCLFVCFLVLGGVFGVWVFLFGFFFVCLVFFSFFCLVFFCLFGVLLLLFVGFLCFEVVFFFCFCTSAHFFPNSSKSSLLSQTTQ